MILWQYIKEKLLFNSNQTICENDIELSYRGVVLCVEKYSHKLKNVRCCAILCKSELMASVALLTCFAAGVTAVPLSARYGNNHYNKILETINPDGIIMDHGMELRLTKMNDSTYTEPAKHPALIMCTSGTTGKPKGIMLSEENIMANIKDIALYFPVTSSDAILISRPLYHCAVLTGEFLTAISGGAKIRFCSETFNPFKLMELLYKHKITVFCGTPTLISMMARLKDNGEKLYVKKLCISGECLGKAVGWHIRQAFPECDIFHVYGLTEAAPRVCYLPPELFTKYPDYVGRPLRSVSVKILDEHGDECPPGQAGLLWVTGENVMLGYYNDPDKTSKVLNGGWLCTGDVAVRNKAGLIKIKGRSDDLMVIAGMNIYPSDIEDSLKKDIRVKEVLVYCYENRFGKQIGMKVVGNFFDTDEVKRMCIKLLPAFQIPVNVELVPELPKSVSGKIVRRPA